MRRERFAKTRVAERQRHTSRARGLLSLAAVLLAGCLVTQEVTFEARDSTSQIIPVRPADGLVARVPFAPDLGCEDQQGMAFHVRIADRDVDDELYWELFLNDEAVADGIIRPRADRAEEREIDVQCIKIADLNGTDRRCNRVTMVVTSELDKWRRGFPALELDLRTVRYSWNVLKSASADPQSQSDDCALPLADGGLFP